jgi:protein phosphatase inhibitor 2
LRPSLKTSFIQLSLAAKKHAEFVKARGRHYSNEAEAMKVCSPRYPEVGASFNPLPQRARKLMVEEEEELEKAANDVPMDEHPTKVNGVKHGV